MYRRHAHERLSRALSDTPVVFVSGARQTGKSTLVQLVAQERPGSSYLTLDDAATLAAASSDPEGFVRALGATAVIDEVQKAPALLPAIKSEVDRDRRAGRFLLTGSADVMLLPHVSDALAGRMEVLTLWPLSQGELEARPESFLRRAFDPAAFEAGRRPLCVPDLEARILRGGFPEAVGREDDRRRSAWFAAYLSTVLRRDVRDLASIEGLTEMPRLLALLAARAGGLLNMSDVSRGARIPGTTLRRYLALLETAFLIHPVRAWHANLGQRLVKAPKLYFSDTGLLTHLLGVHAAARIAESPLKGACFENLVLGELLKQASWNEMPVRVSHFRTGSGREADFLLEAMDGRVVGVEVKASATVRAEDLSGLRALLALVKPRAVAGLLLYAGEARVPFGEGLWALPIASLWED